MHYNGLKMWALFVLPKAQKRYNKLAKVLQIKLYKEIDKVKIKRNFEIC